MHTAPIVPPITMMNAVNLHNRTDMAAFKNLAAKDRPDRHGGTDDRQKIHELFPSKRSIRTELNITATIVYFIDSSCTPTKTLLA